MIKLYMKTSIKSFNLKNKRHVAQTIAIIFDKRHKIPDYLRKRILKDLMWAATENNNEGQKKKYIGQPYWSVGALKKVLNNIGKRLTYFEGLRHEHAVPKKYIIEKIQNSNKKENEIFKIIDNWGHVVVVSKDEDQLLDKRGLRSKMAYPLENNKFIDNVFSRYKAVGIKVCDVRKVDIKKMTKEKIEELEKNAYT